MKTPLIVKSNVGSSNRRTRDGERGITMVLVAISMVAIMAMAALSIDVITLYLAREEAQRSADDAALAAAKIIALSGITGDPTNSSLDWGAICGPDDGVNGLATRVAKAVATQNSIGGQSTATPTVTYSAGAGYSGAGSGDCTSLNSTPFGVNPLVTVSLTRPGLPTFFSRIWGYTGEQVSASATAEAFNPSNSGSAGDDGGVITPVQPKCVKPWVVPNQDPLNPTPNRGNYCNQFGGPGACQPIVRPSDGSIVNAGISIGGTGATGVIGETFWLVPDCQQPGSNCTLLSSGFGFGGGPVQPEANYSSSFGPGGAQPPPNLLYVPGQVTTPVIGIPSCTQGGEFEQAIEGCDAPTNYSCGVPNNGNIVDTTIAPGAQTTTGVQCLIHQADPSNITGSSGQDYFGTFAAPNFFPFQILAGSSSPMVSAGLAAGSPISVSNSIVSLPIYDNTATGNPTLGSNNPSNQVTFVGFLQVFINAVDQSGDVKVTVLNVAGCGNTNAGASTNPNGPIVANSPIAVRLITPP